MNIDKRKNYYLIFDTETAGEETINERRRKDLIKHIYDIGYCISDKENILLKRNFLVKEIFTDTQEMKKAYYYEKMPKYLDMLQNGDIKMLPLANIIKIMQQDIKNYNVKFACAYNIGFDLDAFLQTIETIYPYTFKLNFTPTKSGKMRPNIEKFFNDYVARKELKILDLWTLACQTLCNQITFQTYYKEYTPKGNIKSTAEIVYNYIQDCDGLFEEEHTALSDSIIETEILFRILKNPMPKEKFVFMPFRLINEI